MQLQNELRGFTLIELMVSISIFSIILGYSAISLHDLYVKKRVESAAQKIYSDLRFAQSESIKLNAPVFVSFSHSNNEWCYGINLHAPCDCNKAQACKLVDREQIVNQSMFRDVSMIKSKFAGNKNYTTFDPRKGFAIGGGVRNGTIWLASSKNDLFAIVISRMGRVRICSPSVSGYSQQCPTAPTI